MDFTTLVGIVIGVVCVLAGQALEGGDVGSIVQLTAAVIVLGGTAGAVVTQFPPAELRNALAQARHAFFETPHQLEPLVGHLVRLARKSRKEGLLPLEDEARREKDPFLKNALLALVDGLDSHQLRAMLESRIEQEQRLLEPGPRLFEAAGGYAPTIGILGAVLGLIHVMHNLSDPAKLGEGIAVAFVATVYGVGSANLIFLPLARKLETKVARDLRRKELIVEGICAVHEGLSPPVIERRLKSFAAKV